MEYETDHKMSLGITIGKIAAGWRFTEIITNSLIHMTFRSNIGTIFLFSFLSLFIRQQSFGQAELPRVIPPSPESSALFRYQDYPVGTSTGVPEIGIPLFSISSGALSLPVSISYHAGGRQVFDQTGAVGLGWTLMAGGRISRTIYGKADDDRLFERNLRTAASVDLNNYQDYEYMTTLDSIGNTEFDVFSYTCGGISGKFFINDASQIVQMPLSSTMIKAGTNQDIFPSRIIDDKGTEYQFNQKESYQSVFPYYTTSKLLTMMVSADKKDTITFSYKSFNGSDAKMTATLQITDDDNRNSTNQGRINYQTSSNYTQYAVQRLTEIRFKTGRLVFNLLNSTDQVSSIQLYNKLGQVIKTVELTQSILDVPTFTGNSNTQKLDLVYFKDAAGAVMERYAFEYQPSYNISGQDRDFWGYLNSGSQRNTVMVPSYSSIPYRWGNGTLVNYTFSGGDRNTTPNTAGVIKKIIYPTGGSTEFFFEGNLCENISGDVFYAPGLRIAKIKSTDNNGGIQLKTYKYGVNETGRGTFISSNLPRETTYSREMAFETRYITSQYNGSANSMKGYRVRTYSSELLPRISELYSEPVFYSQIAVYDGELNQNVGKTVYTFRSSLPHEVGYLPMPNMSVGNTRTELNMYNATFLTDPNIVRPFIRKYSYFKQNIRLANTQSFINVNNVYVPVKSVYNNYVDTETAAYRGMVIDRVIEGAVRNNAPDNLPVYRYADYFMSTGTSRLDDQMESWVENGRQILKTTKFLYNSNQLVSQTKTTRSNGDTITTTTKYPFDLPGAVNLQMKDRNMINYGLEQEVRKGQQTLSLLKTDYKDWGNGIIAPESISTKTGSGALEPRVIYSAYLSQSMPTAVAKTGGAIEAYLYGYDNTVPIAAVSNATSLSCIAFANFESAQKGNWSYSSAGVNTSEGRTGKRCFQSTLTSATIPAGNYTVTMWAKGVGNITVNGKTTAITAKWTLYSWSLSSPGTVNINPNGNKIDDVRLLPADAQMTTYTYDPLVGVTSVTDTKGMITFYEYDNYQRLTIVRDFEDKIIKKVSYNSLNPGFQSDPVSITKTKNNCPTGYYGATVTYSLDKGAFTSNISKEDANLKAQAELQKNGQNYANTTGECLQFVNDYQFRQIQKNNCTIGIGSEVKFEVQRGTFTSSISIADANQKALQYIDQQGQTWANANGTCLTTTFKSVMVDGYTSKSCPFGYAPSPSEVYFKVNAGAYTSLISQDDANQQAMDYYNANRFNYADQNSSCSLMPTRNFSISNSTSYSLTATFSSSQGSRSTNIPPGTTSINFPAYSTIYISIGNSACNTCKFRFTYGSETINGSSASLTANGNNSVTIGNGL